MGSFCHPHYFFHTFLDVDLKWVVFQGFKGTYDPFMHYSGQSKAIAFYLYPYAGCRWAGLLENKNSSTKHTDSGLIASGQMTNKKNRE